MRRFVPGVAATLVVLAASACADRVPTSKEDAARLVRKLESEGSRENAAQLLRQAPQSVSWTPLLALVRDTSASPAARVAAIRVVSAGENRDWHIPKSLLRATEDASPEVRGAAIDALVESGAPSHSVRLERRAAAETDQALKNRIAASLPRYEDRRREWFYRELEQGRASSVRVLAARSLGELARPADVPRLLKIYETSTPEVQYELIMSLAKIGGDEATAFVVEQLVSDDPFHRAAAANGVEQQLKAPTAVGNLGRMLKEDSVGENRVSAAYALLAIGTPEARKELHEGCAKPPANIVRLACEKTKKSFPKPKSG